METDAIADAPHAAASQRAGPYDLFVSDLHLTPERAEITRAFAAFLRADAIRARSLYILGDLFDYWVGDDDLDDPFHAEIAAELSRIAEAGCSVYLMHGNRDFLLGERFVAAARARLLADPTVIEQAGIRTVLMHGDTLCVDDHDYQAFRAKVRTEAWQRDFLAKPLAERRAIALKLRADSRSSQQRKSDAIMDATPHAVAEAFRRHQCARMIHGHTHRPARHEHCIDGQVCERWVLADWYSAGSFLRCDARGRCEAFSAVAPKHPRSRSRSPVRNPYP